MICTTHTAVYVLVSGDLWFDINFDYDYEILLRGRDAYIGIFLI